MKYLDVIYHDIHDQPDKYVRRFLLVSCLVGFYLIIIGSIPQLFLIHELSEPVIMTIYLYIWVKQTRTFYKTLRWRCVEYKIRGVSSQIVRRSVKSCRHFAVFMSMMGIGLLSFILHDTISKIFFLIMIFLHYGPCLFHYLYGTPLYEPLLTTNQQIKDLDISSKIVLGIGTALVIVAHLSFGLQYLLVTVAFFGTKLWKILKYRFGKVRTRFTPSLTDPLLIN